MVSQTLHPEDFRVRDPESIRAICQDMPVMNLLAGIPTRLAGRARRDLIHLKALSSVRHVSGSRRVELAEDQVGAVVPGQDAAFYLPEMLAHHFRPGMRNQLSAERCALSRHALARLGKNSMMSLTRHLSTGLRIADVIWGLRHYRFAGDVVSRERARAQSGQGARKDLLAPALTESGVAP